MDLRLFTYLDLFVMITKHMYEILTHHTYLIFHLVFLFLRVTLAFNILINQTKKYLHRRNHSMKLIGKRGNLQNHWNKLARKNLENRRKKRARIKTKCTHFTKSTYSFNASTSSACFAIAKFLACSMFLCSFFSFTFHQFFFCSFFSFNFHQLFFGYSFMFCSDLLSSYIYAQSWFYSWRGIHV